MSDDIRVVGLTKLSRGITEEQFQAFIDEQGLTFPNGLEDGMKASNMFVVSSIPSGAILKDGVVIWRGNTAALKPNDYREIIANN
ncbi:MAG: hypothetical protein HN348_11445 [Proteobacteria bacterium]|nr:hypothetical protein [Pseudomonadota bacterium]